MYNSKQYEQSYWLMWVYKRSSDNAGSVTKILFHILLFLAVCAYYTLCKLPVIFLFWVSVHSFKWVYLLSKSALLYLILLLYTWLQIKWFMAMNWIFRCDGGISQLSCVRERAITLVFSTTESYKRLVPRQRKKEWCSSSTITTTLGFNCEFITFKSSATRR